MDAGDLRQGLEAVLANYAPARATEALSSESAVYRLFGELKGRFGDTGPLSSRSFLRVRVSVGQGNWAKVPWIAFLDARETKSAMVGVYCAFLFRQDMRGVYFALTQGVDESRRRLGRTSAVIEFLRARAEEVLAHTGDLAASGFSVGGTIDLGADRGSASRYASSAIAYKLYERGLVPAEPEILRDLESLLRAYEHYVNAKSAMPRG